MKKLSNNFIKYFVISLFLLINIDSIAQIDIFTKNDIDIVKEDSIEINKIIELSQLNKEIEYTDNLTSEKKVNVEIIIIRSKIIVDSNLLDSYPNLKFIARVGVWLDKINLEECKKRWIKVLNTPWANADSVADLVLAGTLNLARKLNKEFSWIENRFDYLWNNIWEKSVWIIGFWNIWKKIYNRFKAFWVKKFYIFDPFLEKSDVEKNEFCEFLEKKENLFSKSDVISFHIPLLNSTKNFLWEKEFKLLKKDVILINTSRWGIIDENILINFLKENTKSWFFADVWEEENELKNPKKELLELTNSIITPHIWAMTKESERNMHFFKELN